MKNIHCILQSKGGVGKSLLTWLLAQKHKDAPSTFFIDLDHSTATSYRRLGSIVGPKRLKSFDILDGEKKMDREKILEILRVLPPPSMRPSSLTLGLPKARSS